MAQPSRSEQRVSPAFGEALRLDPTDRRSLRSLSASLSRLGESRGPTRLKRNWQYWTKSFALPVRLTQSKRCGLENNCKPSPVFRNRSVGITIHSNCRVHRQAGCPSWISGRNRSSSGKTKPASTRFVTLQSRRCWGSIHEYPLPKLEAGTPARAVAEHKQPKNRLQFRDVAERVGVRTSFVSGYSLSSTNFYLYQANGGGIAAFDYDLDGRCDLYFAIGRRPQSKRKLDGQSTVSATAGEHIPRDLRFVFHCQSRIRARRLRGGRRPGWTSRLVGRECRQQRCCISTKVTERFAAV